MTRSLLRFVDSQTVRNRFNRIAHGNATLTGFKFSYALPPQNDTTHPLNLDFSVQPNSNPPTNIHVIIGRNGVGKTHCFRLMSSALRGDPPEKAGTFQTLGDSDGVSTFTNLVSIAFSAFDEFDPPPDGTSGDGKIRYAYVGLRRSPEIQKQKNAETADPPPRPPKTPTELTEEFIVPPPYAREDSTIASVINFCIFPNENVSCAMKLSLQLVS